MKLRLFTGLALVLALGGCASYGYVDDGGGYYSGGSTTQYRHAPGYGGYGYGYGVYGYGSPYYGYRYNPGWALGVGYGSGYGYRGGYPYYSGGGHGGHYRPPYYIPRPPAHRPRPDDHDGRPDRPHRPDRPDRPPQHVGGNPPLDRAPWRDLDRVREGNASRPDGQMRPIMLPRADGEAWHGPSPTQRPTTGPRPNHPGAEGAGRGYRVPPGPRVSSREEGAVPRQVQPRMQPRMEPRSSPRPSESLRRVRGGESETRATAEP